MSVVLEAKPDRVWQSEVRKAEEPTKVLQDLESSHWVWRESRGEIRCKDAWVVCGSEEDVKKLEDKKEAKESRVSEIGEEIEGLVKQELEKKGKVLLGVRKKLGKKRAELAELQGKLKLLKGRPVSLKQFLEEVVLPSCELCPP
jgi:hypothetical protein